MRKWIRFFYCVTLVLALFVGLNACSHQPTYVEDPVFKNLSERERNLIKEIDASGIQVIKQGMRFTFVIPTDGFFDHDTHELKPEHDRDLDRLAEFIVRYTHYFAHPRITVAGYTDKVWLNPARRKLSRRYARAIAAALQEDGVTNIISVRGEAAKYPIASNHYPMGTAFNKRVEVVIR